MAALRGLSVNDANKMKIVQEGGLEPLTLLLRSMDIEIQREVCAALANLAYADENKCVLPWVPPLFPRLPRLSSSLPPPLPKRPTPRQRVLTSGCC